MSRLPARTFDPSHLLAVARAERPADLLLRNTRIVNVFSGEIESGDIAVCGDRIAGIGSRYRAAREIDCGGGFVAPGLIDAHVHIESSLCTPPQFARAVVPRGVTTAVIDPHEIANVAGVAGVVYMIESSRGLPLRVVVMASSCVPATPMGSAGSALTVEALLQLRQHFPEVLGLAEVMNFPGVISGDGAMRAKIDAFAGRPIDGHCPGVSGAVLNAYVAAGVGSDHECVSVDEAREKLSRGLYILIREATNARNLHALLPLVTPANARRICFCTDDRQPADLLGPGSIDMMVREAIGFGIDPVDAIRMATLNACEWFGLHDRGAVAPGRLADMIVFDDLRSPVARMVISGGEIVAEDGISKVDAMEGEKPKPAVRGRCQIDFRRVSFRVPAAASRARVIGSIEGQLITECRVLEMKSAGGELVSDMARDILKIAVIERHRGTGNVGLGFIQGIGLKRGAIAGTVAHDHHNLVVIGADDASMRAAVARVAAMGGGLCVADGGRILAELPLTVAGLMSEQPIERVRDDYDRLLAAAKQLGSKMADPFMAMSFMALEVIPVLKLTDQGLVDVTRFEFVDLCV